MQIGRLAPWEAMRQCWQPPNHSILLTAASFGWIVEAAAADRLRSAH